MAKAPMRRKCFAVTQLSGLIGRRDSWNPQQVICLCKGNQVSSGFCCPLSSQEEIDEIWTFIDALAACFLRLLNCNTNVTITIGFFSMNVFTQVAEFFWGALVTDDPHPVLEHTYTCRTIVHMLNKQVFPHMQVPNPLTFWRRQSFPASPSSYFSPIFTI